MTAAKLCPVPGCGAPIKRRGRQMCWECWKRTPRDKQRAVSRSWRAVLNGDEAVHPIERINVYRIAVADAVKASEAAR